MNTAELIVTKTEVPDVIVIDHKAYNFKFELKVKGTAILKVTDEAERVLIEMANKSVPKHLSDLFPDYSFEYLGIRVDSTTRVHLYLVTKKRTKKGKKK